MHLVSPLPSSTNSESFICFCRFVKSISGSDVNSMSGFLSIFTLLVIYLSGGSFAENSPVSESVRIKMNLDFSSMPAHELLLIDVVSLSNERILEVEGVRSSWQLNENDSLLSFKVIVYLQSYGADLQIGSAI